MGYRLQATGYRLPARGYRLLTAGCRLIKTKPKDDRWRAGRAGSRWRYRRIRRARGASSWGRLSGGAGRPWQRSRCRRHRAGSIGIGVSGESISFAAATAESRAVTPAVAHQPAEETRLGATTAQPVRRSAVSTMRASTVQTPVMPSLEPLVTEPIVLSTVDVPPLESQATTIEQIEIEDITIDPLAASND